MRSRRQGRYKVPQEADAIASCQQRNSVFTDRRRWCAFHGTESRAASTKFSHPPRKACLTNGLTRIGDARNRTVPQIALRRFVPLGEILIDQLHDQGVPIVVVSGYAVLRSLTDKVVSFCKNRSMQRSY